MKVISLHWFATEQQTSIFRQQKFRLVYPKYSADFNELSINI